MAPTQTDNQTMDEEVNSTPVYWALDEDGNVFWSRYRDLSDLIYEIPPQETPFFRALKGTRHG